MNERDALRLRDLLDCSDRIAAYLEGVDEPAFLSNRMLQDAVIWNLEVIGEACANLSGDLTRASPDIPWHRARAIRNWLVYGYFDADLRLVLRTAREPLPSFARQVRALIDA